MSNIHKNGFTCTYRFGQSCVDDDAREKSRFTDERGYVLRRSGFEPANLWVDLTRAAAPCVSTEVIRMGSADVVRLMAMVDECPSFGCADICKREFCKQYSFHGQKLTEIFSPILMTFLLLPLFHLSF